MSNAQTLGCFEETIGIFRCENDSVCSPTMKGEVRDFSSSVKSLLILQKAYAMISKCFSNRGATKTVSFAINGRKHLFRNANYLTPGAASGVPQSR